MSVRQRAVEGLAYRPEIDGLRAIAVLAVIFFHAGFNGFSGGYLGVDVFFVISGYLITSLIAGGLRNGAFSILTFYERRSRRILPALVLTCAVSALAAWKLMLPGQLYEFGRSLVAVSFFVSNIFFYNHTGYFAIDADLKPLLHTWSLAIEEQFYILYPALLVLVARAKRITIVPVLVALAVLSLAAAEWTSRTNPDLAFFALHTRGWELLLGALIAFGEARLLGLDPKLKTGLAWIGLAAIVVSLAIFSHRVRHPSLFTLIPVGGTALAVAFARESNSVGRLLSWPPLVGTGLISYSLYLIHFPAFVFYRLEQARDIGPWEFVPIIAATFALAYLSWRFVEQPCRNRAAIPSHVWVAASVALLLTPIAIGAYESRRGGHPSRLNAEVRGILKEVKEGDKERRKGTLLDTCHFDTKHGSINTFLARWNCVGDPKLGLLVFGDSHSADKAWALRQAGIPVGSIGAGGCALLPTARRPHCTQLIDRVVQLAKSGKVSGIILAHRWTMLELEPELLDEFAAFWGRIGVPILLFTPMPEFSNFEEQLMRRSLFGEPLTEIPIDKEKLARGERALATLASKPNFTLINTRALFCGGDAASCTAFENGRPLVIDYGHCSPLGAKRLATRLVADPAWTGFLADVQARRSQALTNMTTESLGSGSPGPGGAH